MAETRIRTKYYKEIIYRRSEYVLFAATLAGLLVQRNGCHAYLSTVHLGRTIKALRASEADAEDSRGLETEYSFSVINDSKPCRSDSCDSGTEVRSAPLDSHAASREAAGRGTSDPEIESSPVDPTPSTVAPQQTEDHINVTAGLQEHDHEADHPGWTDPQADRLGGRAAAAAAAHGGVDSYACTAVASSSAADDHDPSADPSNLEKLLSSPGQQTTPAGHLSSSDTREPRAEPVPHSETSPAASRPPGQERADDEAEHDGARSPESFAMRELLQRREAQDARVRAAGARVADALPPPQRASFDALAAFAYGSEGLGGDDAGGDRLSREDARALDAMAICGDRSGVLLAFLRHAEFDLGRAKESVRRCCAWRRENEVGAGVRQEDSLETLEKDTVVHESK